MLFLLVSLDLKKGHLFYTFSPSSGKPRYNTPVVVSLSFAQFLLVHPTIRSTTFPCHWVVALPMIDFEKDNFLSHQILCSFFWGINYVWPAPSSYDHPGFLHFYGKSRLSLPSWPLPSLLSLLSGKRCNRLVEAIDVLEEMDFLHSKILIKSETLAGKNQWVKEGVKLAYRFEIKNFPPY